MGESETSKKIRRVAIVCPLTDTWSFDSDSCVGPKLYRVGRHTCTHTLDDRCYKKPDANKANSLRTAQSKQVISQALLPDLDWRVKAGPWPIRREIRLECVVSPTPLSPEALVASEDGKISCATKTLTWKLH